MTCLLTIKGVPGVPTITEINIREKPTVNSTKKFTAPIGMSNIKITDCQPDAENTQMNGKVYQWFKVEFPGGATGWARDDLVEIQGDCAQFGYTDELQKTLAFDLVRQTAAVPAPIAPVSSVPTTTASTPATTTSNVIEFEAQGKVRVRAQPTTSGAEVRWIQATEIIKCEKDSRTEASGYVWWKHTDGWSAEKSLDGSQVFLMPAVIVGGPVVPISSRAGFDDPARIKKASYLLTAAFEGGGYAAINDYDEGIISYGIIQFTLAAGSLITVLQNYLAASQSDVAKQLRSYQSRVEARDASLRGDTNFKNLLVQAASEDAMVKAQHSVADAKYWDKVWKGYIEPRGLVTPLGIALLFDMGVNFGTSHGFVRLAEQQLGVQPQSKPGTNGITEEQLIQRVAELRKASHDKQAKEQGYYGLMKRGNFWMRLVNQGDWGLQGDNNGNVYPAGKTVQVRNP